MHKYSGQLLQLQPTSTDYGEIHERFRTIARLSEQRGQILDFNGRNVECVKRSDTTDEKGEVRRASVCG